MTTSYDFKTISLSDAAIHTYLTLLVHHPVNGSQLSKHAAIARPRIYDILRQLKSRGFVSETAKGVYVALPPAELIRQLRRDHEKELARLEGLANAIQSPEDNDFIWTVTGYSRAMDKAREMIQTARTELYVRLFPQEAEQLIDELTQAQTRGVAVKCIFMQPFAAALTMQVIHPQHETMASQLGGRSFDLVVDRKEFAGGMFTSQDEHSERINWGRNRWFVISGRDSLRHDFFHYFLYKTQTCDQELDEKERQLYETIMNDG